MKDTLRMMQRATVLATLCVCIILNDFKLLLELAAIYALGMHFSRPKNNLIYTF